MVEKISGISLKTMFQHEGYGCHCAKDTVNTSPNENPTVTLKVCPDTSTQLLFSYAPKDGLNMTGIMGPLSRPRSKILRVAVSRIILSSEASKVKLVGNLVA